MQKLDSRYTPMSISRAQSNCGQPLKDFREKISMAGIKTVSNNPDYTLTVGIGGTEQTYVCYLLSYFF